jgi:hypothetical protein
MADTRGGGSGFSFNDIAADRAGTRFGQRAVQQAAALAERLATGTLREQDLMPAFDDLPEFLSETAFRQQFGSVGSPAYAEMLERIDRRIAGLGVLQ